MKLMIDKTFKLLYHPNTTNFNTAKVIENSITDKTINNGTFLFYLELIDCF